MSLTNQMIDSYIETLKAETSGLDGELEVALNKKERGALLRRHTNLERIIKLLYSLKAYNED